MRTRARTGAVVLTGIFVLGLAGCGAATQGSPTTQPLTTTTPPSVTLSPAASEAGAPASLLDAPTEGDLPAGAYYLDLPAYPARIDFMVPDGWWYFWPGETRQASDVHAILVNSEDTGAANGSAWGVAFTLVDEVRVDPCNAQAGTMDPSVTESAGALAEAFSSWPGFPVTTVEDATVGGYAGKRVEITRAEDTQCSGPLFFTPADYAFEPIFSSSEPEVNQFTLLDVEGSVLTVWTTDFPGTTLFEEDGGASPDPQAHLDDQVQLHGILDSIVITPR